MPARIRPRLRWDRTGAGSLRAIATLRKPKPPHSGSKRLATAGGTAGSTRARSDGWLREAPPDRLGPDRPCGRGRDGSLRARWSRRRRDHLDLDLELRPREARDDHQRRGWRGCRDMAVPGLHVGPEVRPVGHERVDAHDVLEVHGGGSQDLADRAEAEIGLGAGLLRDLIVLRDPELARSEQQTIARRDLHALAVIRE